MQDIPEDFFKTNLVVSWGVILRADLNTIAEIKIAIAQFPGVKIAYQITSGEKLRIVPMERREDHG
ncbi:hypothetical protein GOV13_03395 [Candidatus Pacearchaeota archaeon]|nr:hypothetical protein [Candidatus Pacearchaeota archaeon]